MEPKKGYQTVKKFPGVQFYESESKRHEGRPDRCFYITYTIGGHKKREKIGWLSHGITAAFAAQERSARITGQESPTKKAARDGMTMADLFTKYREWSEHNLKRPQDDDYRWRCWIEEALGKNLVSDVKPLDIEKVIAKVSKKRSPQTAKNVLSLLKRMFNKGIAWEIVSVSPAAKVRVKVPDNKRLRFLTKDEADLMLRRLAQENIKVYMLARLAIETGMRRGECYRVRPIDCDFKRGMIVLPITKNMSAREVHMTRRVRVILKLLCKGRDQYETILYWSEAPRTFERIANELFNQGVSDRLHRVTFHTLRHTFASWLAMAGTPLLVLKELMGHKTLAMVARYAKLMPSTTAEALQRVFD